MSSKNETLGVKDVKGVLVDLLEKLIGDDWQQWLTEIKKFLCKEPCWVKNQIAKVNGVLRQIYADEVIMADGRIMVVHEVVENADFVAMHNSFNVRLEKLWTTKREREAFCKEQYDKLRKNGYATFFLHKKDETKPETPDNLEVAHVRVFPEGLNVCMYPFEHAREWTAKYQHRLVSPLN